MRAAGGGAASARREATGPGRNRHTRAARSPPWGRLQVTSDWSAPVVDVVSGPRTPTATLPLRGIAPGTTEYANIRTNQA